MRPRYTRRLKACAGIAECVELTALEVEPSMKSARERADNKRDNV
jgi:hypothetical protein